MSLKNDSFPASAAFDSIAEALKNDADRKDAIKNAKAIFGFTLKNSSGQTESWHVDLKNNGTVGKGTAPQGQKADATLVLSDADFGKMVEGKAKAQQLFMSGKLKIKGAMMKATKLEPIMAKTQNKAKL